MIIVDASIAAKWLLPEPDSEKATTLLLEERTLIAPELIRIEVYGALTKAHRLSRIDTDSVEKHCGVWDALLTQGALSLSPDEIDIKEAVRLSVQLSHPVQDCLYLSAAQRLKAPLATTDNKLAQKAADIEVKVMKLD